MLVIGLTGSIGMGKSATGRMFRDLGIPVHDSDQAVHDLYRGKAIPAVAAMFPSVVDSSGVNRAKLAELVLSDADALKRLESVIHPLVVEERLSFVRLQASKGLPLAVCDVPLLLETGADRDVDLVLVVSAPAPVQKARVLARPGMTQGRFDAIITKQLSDAEKRRRAHIVIDTGSGFESARKQVLELVRALAGNAGGGSWN